MDEDEEEFYDPMWNADLNQALGTAKPGINSLDAEPVVVPDDTDRKAQISQQVVRLFIGGEDKGDVPAQISYIPQYNFNFDMYTPEKSQWDLVLDQIRSGAATVSELLDVRKYMLPLAALTVMNSDVLTAGLLDKFKSTKAANKGLSKAVEELAQTERSIDRGPGERPSWRQSEKDVGKTNPDYEAQKSFKDGQEVPYGTKGSVRPDYYTPGSAIEVKNYDVTTASGRTRLIDNISGQVVQRYDNLPQCTGQKVVIDVRGQNITNDVLKEIRDSVVSRTGGNVEIEFLR